MAVRVAPHRAHLLRERCWAELAAPLAAAASRAPPSEAHTVRTRAPLAARRWAEHVVPDLVLKLHVRPDVAQRRKPDMELQDLERRAEAVRSLRFPGVTETVDIDADEPLEQVARRIRRCIWRKL